MVFTSDGLAGLDLGGWEMVMASGRSGKSQPRSIEVAAIKASPVNGTLFITEPGQLERASLRESRASARMVSGILYLLFRCRFGKISTSR